MAYQNVGTPRFYVCILSYLKAIGDFRVWIDEDGNISTANLLINEDGGGDLLDLIGINPSSSLNLIRNPDVGVTYDYLRYQIISGVHFRDIMPNDKNFAMMLGHNLASAEGAYYVQEGGAGYDEVVDINYLNRSERTPQYDGFSITIGNDANNFNHNAIQFRIETLDDVSDYSVPLKIGSLLYGTYYDMPNAPNLSLTMSREYGSAKEYTTYNGGSVSNTMWTKPPQWGDLGAWELLDPAQNSYPQFSRSGRRVWKLTFSYMDDSDLWGSNQMLSLDTLTNEIIGLVDDSDLEGGASTTGDFNYNLLTDDNFFSQVWHKTLAGTLPFIFQPDGGANGNNNPDQFAICKIAQDSIQYSQVANTVYNIKLKIIEIW